MKSDNLPENDRQRTSALPLNLSILNSIEGRIEVREGKRFFIYGTLHENTWQPELLLSQLDLTFLYGAPDPLPEWRDELGVCMMELCIAEDKVYAFADSRRLTDFSGPSLVIPGQVIGFETRRTALWVQIDGGRWRVRAAQPLQPGSDCVIQLDPAAITWRSVDGRTYPKPESMASQDLSGPGLSVQRPELASLGQSAHN